MTEQGRMMVKGRVVRLHCGSSVAYMVVRCGETTTEIIIDMPTCSELRLQQGDEITVSRIRKSANPIDSIPRLDRVIPKQEWKQLELANLKLALRQTNGKVGGSQGAARLLGVPVTTLHAKLQRAGIIKNEYK